MLRRFLNDCEMGPVAPTITGINSAFISHTRCIYIARSFYIESSRLLSWPHFCLPKLQQVLTYVFLFLYHRVRCPVCQEWFGRFTFVDSLTQFPYIQDMSLLLLLIITAITNAVAIVSTDWGWNTTASEWHVIHIQCVCHEGILGWRCNSTHPPTSAAHGVSGLVCNAALKPATLLPKSEAGTYWRLDGFLEAVWTSWERQDNCRHCKESNHDSSTVRPVA
jgi:hypothetical protein